MKNWYALYVKPRTEKKVKTYLEQKEIECYLPLKKELRQWSDRKKWVQLPVISGYIFINILPAERLKVLQTKFISGFVRHLGVDAIIPEEQINTLKHMLGQNEFDIKIDNSNYIKGEYVKVIAGPLIGLKGNLVSIKNRKTIVVQLEQINLNILVELPPSHIEKENKTNS